MEEKKKDVTIYDIASILNLSPSTVSRALNDNSNVGNKTKKAVKKLALELGYRPNTIASSLRTTKSNTIGIMVSWINRPFVSSLISGAEKAARAAGYNVIIAQSYDETAIEIENLKGLYNSRISALIVSMAMETEKYEHFDLFIKNGIPVIFVDRIPKLKKVSKVKINNFNAAFDATQHLIDQGCSRIAHFGGSPNQTIYEDRMHGYIAALKKNNIEVDHSIIFNAKFLDVNESKQFIKKILAMADKPDGIFCANDQSAVTAIQELTAAHFKIPEDIAIIGFNNDPVCEIIKPSLSSIDHPAAEMGRAAIEQALLQMDGNGEHNKTITKDQIILDTNIIVRESSNRLGLK